MAGYSKLTVQMQLRHLASLHGTTRTTPENFRLQLSPATANTRRLTVDDDGGRQLMVPDPVGRLARVDSSISDLHVCDCQRELSRPA